MNVSEKRLFEENVALRIILRVVLDGIANKPTIRKRLTIASLDAALQSDDFGIPAMVARLLDA